jgi:hypothetical protein
MSKNTSIEFRPGNRCNTSADGGTTNGYFTKLQVLPNPGKVLALVAHNKSTTVTYFLLIFDTTAEPSAGAVPDFAPIPLEPTGDGGAYLESQLPREFARGCWIMLSTTAATLNLSEDDDVWITAFKG